MGLGQMLTDRLIALAGSGDAIEAYGKAAVVGLNGEVEHASGLIHTLRFGNFYREAVEAKSYLAFTNTRGTANAPIIARYSGIMGLIIAATFVSPTAAPTNRTVPTGGVHNPIERLNIRIIPKCTGEMPSATASARMVGKI